MRILVPHLKKELIIKKFSILVTILKILVAMVTACRGWVLVLPHPPTSEPNDL